MVLDKPTGNKTNKHIKKNSRFRNNRILTLVVLVLLFQHPVLVLGFKQKVCLSLARCLAETHQFFFLSFRGSCLVSLSLGEVWLVLRFRRSALWPTSHPALKLGFRCCFTGGLFLCLPPFLWARSEIRQSSLCCQHVMLVCITKCWLAVLFDFGCCSLTKKMCFVYHYLPCFRQWLITCPLSFPVFFIESSCGDQLLASSSPVPQTTPCFQFLVYYSVFFFFLQGRGQSVQGAMLVYPMGSCGNTTWHLFAHLLVCVSQAGLEQVSGVTWAPLFSQCNMAWRSFVQPGGSGYQSFDSSLILQSSVAPTSQQNFWFMELTLSASALWSPSWTLSSRIVLCAHTKYVYICTHTQTHTHTESSISSQERIHC
jgi:hypothetical protein